MTFYYFKAKAECESCIQAQTWTIWLVNVRFLGLFLEASMEVLPFLTRPSRQVFCKPVISTPEELIRQKSNPARKKEKIDLVFN